MTEDKQLFTFGSGQYGECGTGDLANVSKPAKVTIPKQKGNKGNSQQEKLMKELMSEVDNKLQ